MAVYLDISRLDRLVMVVVIGAATANDMMAFVRQFTASDMMPYRKIIDITAGTLSIEEADLPEVAALLRDAPDAAIRGPLAFVVDSAGCPIAEKFVELTGDDRPAKVFNSIHAARRWLDEHARILPRR
jgi:hypothetical protein